MTIKLVVDREDVKAGMALPNVDDIDAALDRALIQTHAYFQGILDTPFEPVEGEVETFFLDRLAYPIIPNGFFRLRLKRGFVKESSVVMLNGVLVDTIDGTFDEPTDVKIDAERGVIHVAQIWADNYVQVTYDAGFDSDNSPPDWLREAVLAYVPTIVNREVPQRGQGKISPAPAEPYAIMLSSHMRGIAFHIRSMY